MPALDSIVTPVKQNGSSILPNGVKLAFRPSAIPHPLDQLCVDETEWARQIVLESVGQSVLEFRSICLEEPPKGQLLPFLESERRDEDQRVSCPSRIARCQYDVVHPDKSHEYVESLVDLQKRKVVSRHVIDKDFQPSFTLCVSFLLCIVHLI